MHRRRPVTTRSLRFAVLTALIGLLSPAVVLVAPGIAQAARVTCPQPHYVRVVEPFLGTFDLYVYQVLSVTPDILGSDTRFLSNGNTEPATLTVTSEKSTTVQITISAGSQATFKQYLQINVSASIQTTRTTTIGVSATTTVPPGAVVLAEYGINGYYIEFRSYIWRMYADGMCDPPRVVQQATNAPTTTEGWYFLRIQ